MKKQFYRVKQLADVRVGRAEKTDLLTEELQHVEKSMEKIKVACSVTSKKLSSCMLSSGSDIEKRKKKLNQLQLGQAMLECAQDLGDSTLLGGVFMSTGESQTAISGELALCEAQIDNEVLSPLSKLVEVDIPNIITTKKKLSKARLDMDACKTRWLNSVKVSQGARGDMANAAAKAEVIKIELEDETAKFDSLQDTLATEMFTFMAGEQAYAQWMVKLLEAQMNYHKAAAAVIEKCLPGIKQKIDDSVFRPVYGCRLEDHLRVTDREIAFVIEECVLFLLDVGMEIEGLFRLAGGALRIKKLKAAFDCGISDLEEFVNDVHAVAGALKMYLRELPEPLLTFDLHDEWIAASSMKDRDQRLQALRKLVEKLPTENKANLRYLICFFAKLAENSEINKMSASNIGIVIGPNLLWQNGDGGVSVLNTANLSAIVDTLIQNHEWFFPGGCDFARQQPSEELMDALAQRFANEESPSDMPSGGFRNDMSKMFNFKENPSGATIPAGSGSPAVQGYYNPLAAQFISKPPESEDDRNEAASFSLSKPHPPLSAKPHAPLTEAVSPPPPSQLRSTSESSNSQDLAVTRNVGGQDLQQGNKSPLPKRSFSQVERKDPPRRPAPPIPSGPKPKLSILAEKHKADAKHPHPFGEGTAHATGEHVSDSVAFKIET